MGFGEKTDWSAGAPRTLDLDATYAAIIKPAVEACGLRCLRADEVTHSGVIDKPMYELLLRADLVIADISTANPNALYELGVRHALRPHATILMREAEGRFPFDLNHVNTISYEHLGKDIGFREATRVRAGLEKVIRGVMAQPEVDSPVFTFLNWLATPPMGPEDFGRTLDVATATSQALSVLMERGRKAVRDSQFVDARACFAQAMALTTASASTEKRTADPYLLQQLALATYKAAQPDPVAALRDAWSVLAPLDPDTSTDPETLGIAGAIQKRLWERLKVPAHLDRAVELYGRGFEVKRDYYNGENYALCLDLRAARQPEAEDADYDRKTAIRVRKRVVQSLAVALAEADVTERSDHKWMLATMANTLRALGRDAEADDWEAKFRAVDGLADWEVQTFEGGKKYAITLRGA